MIAIGSSCYDSGGWFVRKERNLRENGSMQEKGWPWLSPFFFFFICPFLVILGFGNLVYDTILVLS